MENQERQVEQNDNRTYFVEKLGHKGYIDKEKQKDYIRLMIINPNMFRPHNDEKIENLIKGCVEKEIYTIMLSETKCRHNTYNVNRIKQNLKRMNSNIVVNIHNSGNRINESSSWLCGGTMSDTWGTMVNMVILGSKCKDTLGRWNSMTIGGRDKKILLMTMCRLPTTCSKGIFTSKAQNNRAIAMYYTSHYRKDVLESVMNRIHNFSEVDDVLFFGDMIEDICSSTI